MRTYIFEQKGDQMEFKKTLADKIESGLYSLGDDLPPEDYERKAEGVAKLIDRYIQMEGSSQEKKKGKNEKILEIFKIGVTVAGIVIPSVITVWGVKTSLIFEEQGTISTTVGRGFMNRLLKRS